MDSKRKSEESLGENDAQFTKKQIFSNKKQKTEPIFINPCYIIPDSEETQNWENVISFTTKYRNKKNLFVIKSLKNELSKDIQIHDDFETKFSTSEEEIINKLIDKNQEIEENEAKRWKIEINESMCSILMVHRKHYKLFKELANSIEEESIDLIMKYFGFKRDKKTQKKSEEQNKDKHQNTLNLESSEVFHEHQKVIGDELYRMIVEKLKETQNIDFECELHELYDDFEFLIILPNRKILEGQTELRLKQVKESCPNISFRSKDFKRIIRVQKTRANENDMQKIWDEFMQEAQKKPKVLYLIIHDEFHYASGRNQSTSKFFGIEKGDYHHSKDTKNRLLPNLITLMVSATPYGFFVLNWIKSNILSWKNFLKTKNLRSTYQGYSKLMEQKKILCDDFEKEIPSELKLLEIYGFSKEIILVLIDYLTALKEYPVQCSLKDKEDKFQAIENIRRCIDDNKLIVLRVAKDKYHISESKFAGNVFLEVVNDLKVTLEIWINSEKNDGFDFQFTKHKKIVLEKAQIRNSEIDTNNLKEKIIFSDVENIPMLMIIIEKGRMGDTFPANCIAFDLRARNTKPAYYNSIIQDVGRAFGYNQRPTLILPYKVYCYLKDVWDTENDCLNLDILHKKHVRICASIIKKKKINGAEIKIEGNGDKEDEDEEKEDEEKEEDEDEVNMYKVIKFLYENSNNPVFLCNYYAPFKHRIILHAEPQSGKTGAFLCLISLFCKNLRSLENDRSLAWCANFENSVCKEKLLDETEGWLKTLDGKENHKMYLEQLKVVRDKRKKEGILEPAKWAVIGLLKHLQKKKRDKTEVILADFGCGDMPFVKFLIEELTLNNTTIDIHFKIDAFDFSANDIQIPELPNNIEVVTHKEVNCAKESNFDKEKYDFVILTCSLWGSENSWKNIIKSAIYALKQNGVLFVADLKKHIPKNIIFKLNCGAGVEVTPEKNLSSDEEIKAEEKFLFIRIKKIEYKPEKILERIPDRK